jgi:hypothetical protein
MLKPITRKVRHLETLALMDRLGKLLKRDAEMRGADWPAHGYDSWRSRTPAEYNPPEPEREGPDPDAERERLLDKYERDRQDEAEGPDPEMEQPSVD